MPAVSFLLHLTGASQESAVLSFGEFGLGGPQLLVGIQSLPSKLSSKDWSTLLASSEKPSRVEQQAKAWSDSTLRCRIFQVRFRDRVFLSPLNRTGRR
jgi:hypothetical protein